jgi:general stress protein 26
MKTTTQSRDPAAYEKLQEIAREIEIAMITTVTPEGALHSRPMITRDFDDGGEIWFFTTNDSGMAHDLEAEHAVNVTYADPRKRRYVSITGNATLSRDAHKAETLWDDALKTYFPNGLEEPGLALLRVQIEIADYWESPGGNVMRIFHRTHDDGDGHTHIAVRATPASG